MSGSFNEILSIGNLSTNSGVDKVMDNWNGVGFQDYWGGNVRDNINSLKIDGNSVGNEWFHQYGLKKYRNNIKTDDDSKIPVKFLEDTICHISFEYKDGDEFFLRTRSSLLINIAFSNVIDRFDVHSQIFEVLKNFYIALKDVQVDDNGTIKKFWILMATQTSLEMTIDNFDFVIKNNNQNYSIYDFANTDRNYVKTNIPITKSITLPISNNEMCFSPDHTITRLYTTPTNTLYQSVPQIQTHR